MCVALSPPASRLIASVATQPRQLAGESGFQGRVSSRVGEEKCDFRDRAHAAVFKSEVSKLNFPSIEEAAIKSCVATGDQHL